MQPDSLLRVDLKCSGNGLLIIINQGRRENIPNIINSLKLFKVLVPFLYLGYSCVNIIAFVIIGSRGRTLKSPEKLMMMMLMIIMIVVMMLVIVMMMMITLITITMMTVMIMTIIMMMRIMTIIRILINLI